MTFFEIETFLAIVHTGSLSAASAQLFVSQPAVSQRLQSLEEKLGCPLFERQKGFKKMSLTHKGYSFLPLAEQWVTLCAEMMSISTEEDIKSIYVGGISSINTPVLSDFYVWLANGEYGHKFDLRVRTNWSNELYELLDKRRIDLALVAEKYIYPNIQLEPIFQEEFYVVMHSDNPFCHQSHIDPIQLDADQEIYLSWSEDFKQWHTQWYPQKHGIYIDEVTMLSKFICDKKWAFVSTGAMMYLMGQGKFQFFRLTQPPQKRTLYLATHRYATPSKVKSIDLFKENLQLYLKEKLEKDMLNDN